MFGAGGLVLAVVGGMHLGLGSGNPSLRIALWSLVCGLAGYLVYGLGLPGSAYLEDVAPGLRGLLIGFGCGLLPLLAVGWLSLREVRSG
jgi:hypothetical protein